LPNEGPKHAMKKKWLMFYVPHIIEGRNNINKRKGTPKFYT
jgi:hypothetical protein